MKCKCVPVGSHKHSVQMKVTDTWNEYHDSQDKDKLTICCDMCLAPYIQMLIDKGIQTVESCCGHGTWKGYIMVKSKHYSEMIKLGYTPETDWNKKHKDLKCFTSPLFKE